MFKNAIVLLAFLAISRFSLAQSLPNFDNIKLEQKADYGLADSSAHLAANLLLSNPMDQAQQDRSKSTKFLIKWMTGSPDYNFTFGSSAKYLGDNVDLMGLYIAAMVKYCIENKASATDLKKVELNSWQILLAYCRIPDNHVKPTKQLKKLMEAEKKGELSGGL